MVENFTATTEHEVVFTGRKVIYSDVEAITRDNLLDELREAVNAHMSNSAQIQYLYDYYRGYQDIQSREKTVRPEINNKITENRANEIVTFKTGYLMGEPVQYVASDDDEAKGSEIATLNRFMFAGDKQSKDKELADWMHICGTGFRYAGPDQVGREDGEAPFEFYTLDPRNSFVVYRNDMKRTPLMGVTYTYDRKASCYYDVYTPRTYFRVQDCSIIQEERANALGVIPIFEYPANMARLGAFEVVLPLLNALNDLDSNRMDDVEQTVQSLLLFHNTDISSEDYTALREQGAIKFRDLDPQMKAEIKYITTTLDQANTQNIKEDLYSSILTICGMPNRNGGSSTSDTGSAVIMRDGWSDAEARAKNVENMFKRSEKQFLRLVLAICRKSPATAVNLELGDIDIRFTRRNYENIQEKSQVLTTMLANPKIHPLLAFTHSGMFVDPELAYKMSEKYAEEQRAKAEETPQPAEEQDAEADTDNGSDDSQNTGDPGERQYGGDKTA